MYSDELNYLHKNKYKEEYLNMIKNYISTNKEIHNILLIIDLIDLVTIYEYHKNDNKTEKSFPLSFIEQLKQNLKDINTMNSFLIKQRLQNTINFIKDTNNINHKTKIYRVRYIFNDIEKVRLKLINSINENIKEKEEDKRKRGCIYNKKMLRKNKIMFFLLF